MIKRMERVGDAMRIVVQGTERIKIVEWKQQDPLHAGRGSDTSRATRRRSGRS